LDTGVLSYINVNQPKEHTPKELQIPVKHSMYGLMAILCHHNTRNLFAWCFVVLGKSDICSDIRTGASFITSIDINITRADA
jgi:hypothetical protein